MNSLIDLTLEKLEKILLTFGEPKFRMQQLLYGIYKKGYIHYDEFSNISQKLKIQLSKDYPLLPLKLIESLVSKDGSKKLLLETIDGEYIESVIIPKDKDKYTLCISTQIGCPIKCQFCATGHIGLKRSLTFGEILAQFVYAIRNTEGKISNVVFMGMGEPFLNYENTLYALKILNMPIGGNISKRKLTISTSGILPSLKKYVKNKEKYRLAFSLGSPFEEVRKKLMPGVKHYPLKEILHQLYLHSKTAGKNVRITIEYVLIPNINDDKESAYATIKIAKNLKAKINIIPYNPIPNANFKKASQKDTIRFYSYFKDANLTVTIRKSYGNDISASCGQLYAKYKQLY
jgi:23S rRNA (adenine2503-C2)-methyltransferase